MLGLVWGLLLVINATAGVAVPFSFIFGEPIPTVGQVVIGILVIAFLLTSAAKVYVWQLEIPYLILWVVAIIAAIIKGIPFVDILLGFAFLFFNIVRLLYSLKHRDRTTFKS